MSPPRLFWVTPPCASRSTAPPDRSAPFANARRRRSPEALPTILELAQFVTACLVGPCTGPVPHRNSPERGVVACQNGRPQRTERKPAPDRGTAERKGCDERGCCAPSTAGASPSAEWARNRSRRRAPQRAATPDRRAFLQHFRSLGK